jgi:hypothetical protein
LRAADPISALCVAGVVVYVSWRLARQTIDALLDAAPAEVRAQILSVVSAVNGVLEVDRIRTRRAGAHYFVDVSIGLARTVTFQRSEQVAADVTQAVNTVLPEADVMVHTIARAARSENLFDRVRAVATRNNLNVHDISVQDFGRGQLHLEQHLELDENLSLIDAHNRVTQLEAEIRQDIPEIATILTHIESEPTLPSQQLMQECDTLFILGSCMPYYEYYPGPGQARCVQVDRDPKRLSLRYPAKVGLAGDVRVTLAALLPRLRSRSDRTFLQSAQKRMEEWREALAKAGGNRSMPLKPEYVAAQLSGMLADDAMISIDCGAHTVYCARHLQARDRQSIAIAGNLATMGPALPYAIAGQLAYPERQSVALVGDGGFTMLMGELATAVKYDLPIKVVVFKNNCLQMVRYEQEGIGNPDFGVGLQPIDFARYAEACGADAFRCATPDEVGPALWGALQSPRPALVEALVDGNEPIAMPGKK